MITLFPSHVLSRILGSLGSHFYIFRNFCLRFVKLMILSPQYFTYFRCTWAQFYWPLLSPFSNVFNLYDIWFLNFRILSPDLCSLCFPRVLIYMIYEFWTSWSFDHSSLPTLEVLDLSFIDLCTPRFPRVLIYMISELWTSYLL